VGVDLLIVFLLKLFQQSLRILPERLQYGLGVFLGRLGFLLFRSRRAIAVRNIRRAFPHFDDRKVSTIALHSFEKLGLNFMELLLIPFIKQEDYARRFSLENKAFADEALSKGLGIMALVFHYGNWEIMGAASGFIGQEVIVLAKPLKKNPHLHRFLTNLRESTGLRVIPNVNTGRDVMKYLRENKVVAILADQREKSRSAVYVDFFGEKAPTSRGIATLAMRTGSPVIPVYTERQGFLRHRLVCGKPLEMERKGNIEELVERNTRKINAALESLIRQNPEEWFWVHRRWGRDR
jgi:KDO2-lipid IV(A) lauroyltransferase